MGSERGQHADVDQNAYNTLLLQDFGVPFNTGVNVTQVSATLYTIEFIGPMGGQNVDNFTLSPNLVNGSVRLNPLLTVDGVGLVDGTTALNNYVSVSSVANGRGSETAQIQLGGLITGGTFNLRYEVELEPSELDQHPDGHLERRPDRRSSAASRPLSTRCSDPATPRSFCGRWAPAAAAARPRSTSAGAAAWPSPRSTAWTCSTAAT